LIYYIGIDIAKYHHDCFITTETGEVIKENFHFKNDRNGFTELLNLLKSLDNVSEIRIGFEATGHYAINLRLFLEEHDYSYMECNALKVNRFNGVTTLRRVHHDKVDPIAIAKYLMATTYLPNPPKFYHKFCLKRLTRLRETLVKNRSKYLVFLTNVLDRTFPEFKPFFKNSFSATAIFIINKYKTADKIANMKDFESLRRISRGKFSYAKFLKLKELAKGSIGNSNELTTIELDSILKLLTSINFEINKLDSEIETIIKELNPPILSIKGIGITMGSAIIAEFGHIPRFKSAGAMLAFAGLEPSVIQSGIKESNGKMVKHGSGYLRYHLMNAALYVMTHEPIFTEFYYKKRNEGKSHRVALSHVAKKLVRVIYKLETDHITFDSTKLR